MKQLGAPTPGQRDLIRKLMARESPHPIDDAQKDRLIDAGIVEEYRRGELIMSAGHLNTAIFMVIDGIIRKWYRDGDTEKTEAFGAPGTLFMSYHGYQCDEPSVANYDACCTTRVLKIERDDFDAILSRSHDFALWCLRCAYLEHYYVERKHNDLQGSARERYDAMVRTRPDIMRLVLFKTIASYLGISPQYLSFLRGRKTRGNDIS